MARLPTNIPTNLQTNSMQEAFGIFLILVEFISHNLIKKGFMFFLRERGRVRFQSRCERAEFSEWNPFFSECFSMGVLSGCISMVVLLKVSVIVWVWTWHIYGAASCAGLKAYGIKEYMEFHTEMTCQQSSLKHSFNSNQMNFSTSFCKNKYWNPNNSMNVCTWENKH